MFSSRPRRVEFLIPRNACALWAYYLEIGSLICGIAGIPAFITGILGVRRAKRNPQAKGPVHARVGIILGGITPTASAGRHRHNRGGGNFRTPICICPLAGLY